MMLRNNWQPVMYKVILSQSSNMFEHRQNAIDSSRAAQFVVPLAQWQTMTSCAAQSIKQGTAVGAIV